MASRAFIFGVATALAASLATGGGITSSLGAAESPCHLEGVERIVAVGDVHGAYDRFVEILRTADLLDARLKWSGGRAHLVQTGDVLDRGADSLKVLDLLKRLQNEARRAGGDVHPLLGNHEAMRLLGDTRYVSPGEYEAFVTPRSERLRNEYVQSMQGNARELARKDTPLGFVELRMAFGREGEYGERLRNFDTVAKINGILFLHGGISPETAGMSCDAINATVRREISTDIDKTRMSPLKALSARADGPLWYRGFAQEPDEFAPKVDEILGRQNARAMVIAHTVVSDGRIRARFGGKVVQIDTGMQQEYQPGGRASALEIQGGVFTAIYQDRREVILRQSSADEQAAVPVQR